MHEHNNNHESIKEDSKRQYASWNNSVKVCGAIDMTIPFYINKLEERPGWDYGQSCGSLGTTGEYNRAKTRNLQREMINSFVLNRKIIICKNEHLNGH